MFVQSINMSNTKWEGVEDTTINNFFKIESRKF